MDVPGRVGEIHVNVGDNAGTLIVGDHNVVNLVGVAAPVLSARAPSGVHRPRDPEGFLDRRAETARALAALRAAAAVEVQGAPRIGKSFLLRHAAAAAADTFADGALLLPPGLAGGRDALQALFEMFWESTPPCAPSATRLRELLGDKRALVAVDHSEFGDADLTLASDVAPK